MIPAALEMMDALILQAVEARWIAEGFPARARVETLLDEESARKPSA